MIDNIGKWVNLKACSLTSIDFADLLSITSSYEKKDADFHLLQERLGTGNNSESYNITTKFHPNLYFPVQW